MPKIQITEEIIQKEYVEEQKTAKEIAIIYGFSVYGVKDAIKRYKINYQPLKRGGGFINRVGMEYGTYKVIALSKKDVQSSWLCVCKNCKKEAVITYSGLLTNKKRESSGCPNCRKKMTGEMHSRYTRNLKNKAKTRGLEFNISNQYLWNIFIQQDRKCALSGIDLCFSSNYRDCHIQTASVDRIDSSKGYVEGNVQWVHKKVNFMKQALSDTEFINLCKLIAENNK